MKQLGKAALAAVLLLAGSAAVKGWYLYKQAALQSEFCEEGSQQEWCDDGPTSILIEEKNSKSCKAIFLRMAVFFSNVWIHFYDCNRTCCKKRHLKNSRKAGL